MSVICTRCVSTNVACEAIVNPNGNVFKRYTDESFLYGQCEDCGTCPELTDPDEVKMDLQIVSGIQVLFGHGAGLCQLPDSVQG